MAETLHGNYRDDEEFPDQGNTEKPKETKWNSMEQLDPLSEGSADLAS
ncbi:MAG TPA: hypothetical protein VJN93_00855 [Candidatus Acidoferrum sp.]|nr:hypothetical protein [Candidatus Acidoferrum sp.]